MTEYALREQKEVTTERSSRRNSHLSLIGIPNKIDQEFPKPPGGSSMLVRRLKS
ncbi:MAG: hypothetical protein O2983_10915 [Planctomycetota bacterium]|nr:hypothetical protein [Planctomycetota bacterium]MDA1160112.1 hypothetical protein [Planctomycetota bacterium]